MSVLALLLLCRAEEFDDVLVVPHRLQHRPLRLEALDVPLRVEEHPLGRAVLWGAALAKHAPAEDLAKAALGKWPRQIHLAGHIA